MLIFWNNPTLQDVNTLVFRNKGSWRRSIYEILRHDHLAGRVRGILFDVLNEAFTYVLKVNL